jgi:two-component system, cell cycle sensor histidine kinase and response regulator CckA
MAWLCRPGSVKSLFSLFHIEDTMHTNNPLQDRETILVVDDEPSVLNIVSSILLHAGFEVLRAASPEEALRIGSTHRECISLLLCDVIMPGQSGPTVAEQFLLTHPETTCLFMAGYPDNTEVVDRIIGRGHAFLAKPFVPKTLIHKVREVLASTPPRALAAPA